MHEKTARSILSAHNGMNLCRGCLHGCIYCDARSLVYQMDHVFEDIELKSNALELLEQALQRKRRPCMIGTGAMSDPYIPLKESLAMTRGALELIEKYGFGVAIQTKSDRILQDLDILKRINDRTKAVVQMTLTTFDEELCRIVEPNVCTTKARYEALKQFQTAGIPTVVWISPLLPFLNDTVENLQGILDYCIDAGVKGIVWFGPGLTLREGNREYFYRQLDRHFPGMKERYIAAYGNAYGLPSPHAKELDALFYSTCRKQGIVCDPNAIFQYMAEFEEKESQLSLF